MPNTNWFKKRLQDSFLKRAHIEGYRSRAVYKLMEIDEKYKIIKKGHIVLDVGAAPGSWSQYLAQKTTSSGKVVSIDLVEMEPIDRVLIIQGDIRDKIIQEKITALNLPKFDGIFSDMAPSTSGIHHADCQNSADLVHLVLNLAQTFLKPGGNVVAKIFEGDGFIEVHRRFKSLFHMAKSVKPSASLAESREVYLVGISFKI